MVNLTMTSTFPRLGMANSTLFDNSLPPLPEYTLSPQPDLVSWFPNFWMPIALPIIVYWVQSMLFHIVDVLDLFPQYRLHTPEEISSRNHVTRWECARDVLVQQILQLVAGAVLDMSEPPDMVGKEDYDVAVWATRIRLAQRYLPSAFALLGLNAITISKNLVANHPFIGGALAGGFYPFLTDDATAVPAFAPWETALAKFIYFFGIPAAQYLFAAFVLDGWQYWLHRMMHMNRWMYTAWHSRHHRLYVPYAYGALYNHPVEGFLLDILGSGVAFKMAGFNRRQGTIFFCISTLKTVDDHCGYAFPWDPLQLISTNNAAYHDIHHQTWGIKTNFSQPFFTIWDSWSGTKYTGSRRDRLADKKRQLEKASKSVEALSPPS